MHWARDFRGYTPRMPRSLLLVAAFCLSCGGSSSKPEESDARAANFCDDDTPCSTVERPFCDLLGEYPASEGTPNSCIPDPATAECVESEDCLDPAKAHCSSSGMCVACLNFSHCNAQNPVCSLTEQRCTSCRQGSEGDNVCGAIDPLQPFCGGTGSCVECLNQGHCEIITAPICSDMGACRGCLTDGECAPQTCNTTSGACE